MSTQKQFGLPAENRLKSRKQIGLLFSKGRSFWNGSFRVIFLVDVAENAGSYKVAFSVGKRSFKKAVDRNRMKRLMRESFRLQQHNFNISNQHSVHIMLSYSGKQIPEFAEVYENMANIINRLNKALERN